MQSLLHRKASPLLIIFAVSLFLSGCGGGGSSGGGGKGEPVSIAINPPSASVATGGTVAFTASVSGAPDTTVTWGVQESGGGSITPDGSYTAPQSEGTFHVTATSRSEPPQTAAAAVTVTRGTQIASAVSVKIIPEVITVGTGESYPFKAAVSGSANTAVTWRLEEGAAAGSVGPDGLYTAPGSPGQYHLTAVSQADPNAQAVAAITVEKPPPPPPGEISVRISPKDPTIRVNERIVFTAAVTGTSNTEVTWSIQQGPTAGTITSAGEYTASGKSGSFYIIAASKADPKKSDTVTVTVLDPITVLIDPREVTLPFGGGQTFTAQVLWSADTEVAWTIDEGDAGSLAADGLTGVYTAPNRAGTFHVRATSKADGTKSVAAIVHVAAGVSVVVTPREATLSFGEKKTFSASVVGSANPAVSWSVQEGQSGGSITGGGEYTAPNAAGQYHIIAASQADPTKTAVATATVKGPGTRTIERVSVASDGTEANSFSGRAFISGDGRIVTFESSASNLVPNDNAGRQDMFFHDRATGQTTRISVGFDGQEANGNSKGSKISSDGRYVAFESEASNLVPGDTNGFNDLFLYDRQLGTVQRVSLDSTGGQAKSASSYAYLNAAGSLLTFFSFANLTPDDTDPTTTAPPADIYLRDLTTGEMTLISVGAQGKGNRSSYCPSISDDGRFIAYQSDATNLVPDDTNGLGDIFVYDRTARTTVRVSVDNNGRQGLGYSSDAKISGDGRFVAITTFSALVPEDTNGVEDIYVYDLLNKRTERVSVRSDGAQGNKRSYDARISRDGRYISFDSDASNLVEGDTNGVTDIFVHDRVTGKTTRLSVGADGKEGNGKSEGSRIAADGGFVAFSSAAGNLVEGDTNNAVDIFVAAIPK